MIIYRLSQQQAELSLVDTRVGFNPTNITTNPVFQSNVYRGALVPLIQGSSIAGGQAGQTAPGYGFQPHVTAGLMSGVAPLSQGYQNTLNQFTAPQTPQVSH